MNTLPKNDEILTTLKAASTPTQLLIWIKGIDKQMQSAFHTIMECAVERDYGTVKVDYTAADRFKDAAMKLADFMASFHKLMEDLQEEHPQLTDEALAVARQVEELAHKAKGSVHGQYL